MKYLVIFMLCLTLLVGCSATPAIEQMPYPEARDGKYGIDTDYWSTTSMETLYNEAVYVVVRAPAAREP